MSMNRNEFEEQPAKKKSKRDGMRVCIHCGLSSGLRCLVCTNKDCNHPFPEKQKNWKQIEEHSKKMTPTYIKEKLFNRMDQLSTKQGWTGILFLVHDVDAGNGRRVYTHSYSTKGPGQKLEKAMKGKVVNLMKTYLFADQTNSNAEPAAQESIQDPSPTTASSATSSLPLTVTATPVNTPITNETCLPDLSTAVLCTSSNSVSSSVINPITTPEPTTTFSDLFVDAKASSPGKVDDSLTSPHPSSISSDSNVKNVLNLLTNANASMSKPPVNSPPIIAPSSSVSESLISMSSIACNVLTHSNPKSIPLPLAISHPSSMPPVSSSSTPAASFLITSRTVDLPFQKVPANVGKKEDNDPQAGGNPDLPNTISGGTSSQLKKISGKIVLINGRKYFQLSK